MPSEKPEGSVQPALPPETMDILRKFGLDEPAQKMIAAPALAELVVLLKDYEPGFDDLPFENRELVRHRLGRAVSLALAKRTPEERAQTTFSLRTVMTSRGYADSPDHLAFYVYEMIGHPNDPN